MTINGIYLPHLICKSYLQSLLNRNASYNLSVSARLGLQRSSNSQRVLQGKPNAKIGKKAMDFFMLIGTASTQASKYCAANLFGPNLRSLRRHCKRTDLQVIQDQSTTIINRSPEEIERLLEKFVQSTYEVAPRILVLY